MLIKYTGKYVNIYFIMKITCSCKNMNYIEDSFNFCIVS